MKQAVKSCKELLIFLDQIEQAGNLDYPQKSALIEDKKNLLFLLELLETANSKDQIREAWSFVNETRHTFGGYVGGAIGMHLNELFDKLWHDILELLSG